MSSNIEAQRKYRRSPKYQEWLKRSKAKRNENARRHHADSPELCSDRVRRSRLKVLYGITLDEFMAKSARQDDHCAICGENPCTAVDHDHVTGAIRGLLCNLCNLGLGNFRDNLQHLASASKYLCRASW